MIQTLKHTTVLKSAFEQKEIIFKQMADNIDESFPIVIDKLNYFSFNLYARGYRVYIYMNIWSPLDGEVLVCT